MSSNLAVYHPPVKPLPIERQIARRVDPDLPAYLWQEEAYAIAGATTNDRDRLLVLTLWHTGGRISEVLQLRRSDFTRDYIRLPNLKQCRRAEKLVFIGPDFALDFLSYCEAQGLRYHDHVFAAKRSGRPLSRIAAYTIVTTAAASAGVTRLGPDGEPRPAWCHLFRHGNAVALMRAGVPPKIVQEQLGHASILTTQRYLQFTARDKREFIGQAKL